jgi:molybdopterin adenylyltransferase
VSQAFDAVKVGIVSVSDRASAGVYVDKGLPALKDWLTRALRNPITFEERLIPDEQAGISAALIALVDAGCSLVLTTGGTGPALRDVTPEATLAVAHKEMPGFGEQMRQISLKFVPTAILSRQCAVIRDKSLILNLPGQPKSIQETLEGLKNEAGEAVVPGIFAAVPYCIDLIGGPYLETDPAVCKAFRPKSAIRRHTGPMKPPAPSAIETAAGLAAGTLDAADLLTETFARIDAADAHAARLHRPAGPAHGASPAPCPHRPAARPAGGPQGHLRHPRFPHALRLGALPG